MGKRKKKPIDKVTTEFLSIGLRSVGIDIDQDTLDKIIDMVELIEDKGKKTSLKDIANLEEEWEYHEKNQIRTGGGLLPGIKWID